jgi:DNA-binding MarR family transcriptional regulator
VGLNEELGLHKPIAIKAHEAILSVYYTAARLKKRADEFFKPHGLTDVQFNVLMLLKHQGGEKGGLAQAQLSDMMLVNRANITSLIDRMERAGLVQRTTPADDRRYNIVRLTEKGLDLLAETEPAYIAEVQRVVGMLKETELDRLIDSLARIREAVTQGVSSKP